VKIQHLLENDDEFFWESMQDHGWKPRGEFLVSPDDPDIAVDRTHCLLYRGVGTGVYYTDAEYTNLLQFEQNEASWCRKNPELLRFASESVQLDGVRRVAWTIQHIKNPSEAVQLAAVQESGWAIQDIKNPSEAVQLAAVRRNGDAIQFIKNPSEAVQLAVVRQNGLVIGYIRDPSEAVQLAAVQQNGHMIRFIKNPSEAVQKAAEL